MRLDPLRRAVGRTKLLVPGARHVLDPGDVLPSERAGAALASAIRLNRAASIPRTNLTESAIFDVARALVVAAAAVVVTVHPPRRVLHRSVAVALG